MCKYFYSLQFFFFISVSVLQSQELKEKNESLTKDSTISNIQVNKESILWVEAGINVSSFQNINSERRFGYSFGLTYSYNFTNSIGIDISGLVSRQSIFLKNRETTTSGTGTDVVYRKFYDHKISILFLELPVMINYKLWDNGPMSFYIGLGFGYSISFWDYSERTNFVITGEILDIPVPEEGYYIGDSVHDNSGKHINAGIWLKHNRFLFKILYINKRYSLMRIDRTHTFSLHFGYQLK